MESFEHFRIYFLLVNIIISMNFHLSAFVRLQGRGYVDFLN